MNKNVLFAPIDTDLHLKRLSGGNESEVYLSDDSRFVVKVKSDRGRSLAGALAEARLFQTVASTFARVVGPAHSIPNYFYLARDEAGAVQTVAVQPYLAGARPLADVDFTRMKRSQRRELARQLIFIINQARHHHRQLAAMPDLYGRKALSPAERARLNRPVMLPWRLWSFFVVRHLLRSQNLMLLNGADVRVVLVDYDPVRRNWLYRFTYFSIRRLLFWRDFFLINVMAWTGRVPW